jgi:trehalose 6-phosphate synthase/phosphatase
MKENDKNEIEKQWRESKNRILFLDYDGTLVEHCMHPPDAVPGENVINILSKLSALQNTKTVIITGRPMAEMDRFLPKDGGLEIIAEHGSFLRKEGSWQVLFQTEARWKNMVRNILNEATEKCEGAFMEEKNASMSWHYRKTGHEAGFGASRNILKSLEPLQMMHRLKVLDGNKVIEIMDASNGKGKAALQMFHSDEYDFVLAVGDDKTDEEMFTVFADVAGACTVKVGTGETAAKFRLSSVSEVLELLNQLSIHE